MYNNFAFPTSNDQYQPDQYQPDQYQTDPYQHSNVILDDDNDNQNYQHQDIPRKEYRKQHELGYTPNIIRWVKTSSYLTHIRGEQLTLLIAGYDHCSNYYLQTLIYGKNDNNNNDIQIINDNQIKLTSQVSDIQFADDHTAVIALHNGQIQLIKLKQNDNYSPLHNDNDDQKQIIINNNNYNNQNKWDLIPISLNNNNPLICYKNQQNNFSQLPSRLTSIAVSTICGNIVASDESGYIYITDIDQQQSISVQACSSSAINSIKFANNTTIASCSMSGQLMLWDIRDLKHVSWSSHIPRKYGSLTSLAIHPNRNRIFTTGTETGYIVLWDIRNNKNKNKNNNNNDDEYKIFSGHLVNTVVNDISFLTNNSSSMSGLVSCGNDGITQMFQTNKDDEWKHLSPNAWKTNLTVIQQEKYPVTNIDFCEDLGIVATCCDSQNLSFYPI